MKQFTLIALLSALVMTAGCSLNQKDADDASNGMAMDAEHCKMMPNMKGCPMMNSGSSDMMDSGMAMNHDMMGHQMNHADMVRSEFDFIYLMIPHHQEAVDTSNLLIKQTAVLKNGKFVSSGYDDVVGVQLLASNIANSQTSEIEMMKGRLADFYSGTTYEGMGYMPMMRDTSMITDLATKEKVRTEDMIMHHQGAVDMANKLLQIMDKNDPLIRVDERTGKFRAALRTFAQDVIAAQSKEIEEMKGMLAVKS